MSATREGADPSVAALARLYRGHPAWIQAARHIADDAESDVYFSHLPGRAWHLVRDRGTTRLLPGRSARPDFVFRFTPEAVKRLGAVEGGVADFAVTLFGLVLEEDASRRVDLRIVSPFGELMRRGYGALLLACGPKLLAFGAARGVASPRRLRRLVEQLRARGPETWEIP